MLLQTGSHLSDLEAAELTDQQRAVIALLLMRNTSEDLRAISQIATDFGSVFSLSGSNDCEAGETCDLQVDALGEFEETFAAVPNDGFRFVGWQSGDGFLCGGQRGDCTITSASILNAPSSDFALQPEFERDSDDDGVGDLYDVFPNDTSQADAPAELACRGPDWIVEPPEQCNVVDVMAFGGRPRGDFQVTKPQTLSVDLYERRAELSGMGSETVTYYCSDFAAGRSRLPQLSIGQVSIHLSSFEGQSLGIDSHVEIANVTLEDITLADGRSFDALTFDFGFADQAQTYDYNFDNRFASNLAIPGLADPYYLLVSKQEKRFFSDKFQQRYDLNNLPTDTRDLLFSVINAMPQQALLSAEVTVEPGAMVVNLDTASKRAEAFQAFADVVFERPPLPPLDELECNDIFDTCAEFIPNWEFRDTLINYGADFLAYGSPDVGNYLIEVLRQWASSDALLNVRNVQVGATGQDDFWPRYEINMIMLSVMEAWSLLLQSGLPQPADVRLIENWIGQVVSFSAITPSGGPGGTADPFNVGYLEYSVKMAWGVLRGNDQLFQEGIEKLFLALNTINPDGSFPREVARGNAAYQYQNITTLSVMYMANLAIVQGYDPFAFQVDGKTLHNIAQFSFNAALDPTSLEAYATEFDYPFGGLPINFDSTLRVDANGRESRFSHGKAFGAWFETYLRAAPTAQLRDTQDQILTLGLDVSRPLYNEMVGANTTCYFATF